MGGILYDQDLFAAETIRRFAGHFQQLLRSVVASPGRRCSQLALLTPQESHQILQDWNATSTPSCENQLVHTLIEAQVQRTPDAIALVEGAAHITYDELNRRARFLATALSAMGVRAETRVALCLERSAELVISILGVLLAGGAYVQLDPTYHAERLAFILADSQASILLTRQHLQARLPEPQARRNVYWGHGPGSGLPGSA
jgi:non-ribosomal peptide synthetase component F